MSERRSLNKILKYYLNALAVPILCSNPQRIQLSLKNDDCMVMFESVVKDIEQEMREVVDVIEGTIIALMALGW
jgi:hypothetical protein